MLGVVAALAGCRSRSTEGDHARVEHPARDADPGAGVTCHSRALAADSLGLPEASGATWVAAGDGRPAYLLVVADSGNHGAFVEVDPATGEAIGHGYLPLDPGASDDLEGVSQRGDTFYAVTSSGWVRQFRREADGYALTRAAYPLAPPPESGRQGMVCASSLDTNCGRNYEGLCLVPAPGDGPSADGECAGFALAKGDGVLYCVVVEDDGRLAVDGDRRISVAPPETLSGCAFSPDGGILWAGSNLFAGNAVYAIGGWRQPAHAEVSLVGHLGPGFAEAIAVAPGGVIYRFSDTGGAPSALDAHICE